MRRGGGKIRGGFCFLSLDLGGGAPNFVIRVRDDPIFVTREMQSHKLTNKKQELQQG